MAEYKKLLVGYVNPSKNGDGHYLAITNVSDEPITIKPNGKLFLNRTPAEILEKYPKIPHYSKDIRIDTDEKPLRDSHIDTTSDNSIPF